MPNTIDERVVEMRFNNSDFEKNVSESMTTIQKLEQMLQFKGVKKGFENIDDAAKQVNLSPMADAVETIKYKFSALEVVGIATLTRLTNSAINMGKRMASALTIDPVKTGYQEYETQLNATQTILSNTQKEGATIDDVNSALDELNKYADLTIYNFTEMTKNIGTFTAAGVKLDTSVSAIQGIANLAAVSGSTSQQASTAMYQLSQALASGTVKLMDWNSVVNAGMGGQVFQDTLIETARSYGIAVDDMIKSAGSFRESLSKGWLSADVLTETLKKFTTSGVNEYLADNTTYSLESIEAMRKQAVASEDQTAAFKEMAATLSENSDLTEDQIYELLNMSQTAEDAATKVKTLSQLWDVLKEAVQSGWSQTWRTIMGDFEEAKVTFTKVSDVLTNLLQESSDARNDILDEWKDFGGRTYLFDGIKNAFNALLSVIKPVKEAFNEIFPATTGWRLADLSKKFRDFTATLILSDDQMRAVKSIFSKVFKVIKVGTTVVKQLFKVFGSLVAQIRNTSRTLLNFVARCDDGTDSVSSFESTIDGIITVIEGFGSIISDVITLIGELIPSIDLAEAKAAAVQTLEPILTNIANALKTVASVAGTVVIAIGAIAGSAIFTAFTFLYTTFLNISAALKDIQNGAVNLEKRFGKVGAFLITTFDKIKEKIKKLKDAIVNLITGDTGQNLMDTLTTKFEEFKNKFTSFVDSVSAKIKEFGVARALLIAYFGTILYVMVSVSNSFKRVSTSISTALGGVGGVFTSLTNAIKSVTAVSKAPMILKIASAIAILAGSLVLLAQCDQAKLQQSAKTLLVVAGSVAAASAIMAALPIAFDKLITGFDSVKLTALGTAMIAMAGSIGIMVLALKSMEYIDTNDLGIRLAALGAMMVGLTAFAAILSKWAPKFSLTSLTLISFAYGIKSFVNTLSSLTDEQFGTIKKNIVVIGEIMALIAVVMAGIGNIRLGSGIGILLAAAAIKIICSALNELKIAVSGLTMGTVADIDAGLSYAAFAIMVITASLSYFIRNSGINKTILSIGASLLAFAVSMKIMVSALSSLVEVTSSMGDDGAFAGKALASFIALFWVFSIVCDKATRATREIGVAFAAFGVGVLAISKAMDILKTVFKGISLFTLAGVLAGLAAITTMFYYVAKASNAAGSAYKPLLAMVAVITALASISALLALFDAGTLVKMGVIAAAIIGVMYGLMLGLSKLNLMDNRGPAEGMLSMVAVIISLVGAIKILSTVGDMAMIAECVAGLTALIATIGVVLYELGQIDAKNALSSLQMLLGMCALLGGIALSLSSVADSFTKLAAIDWDKSRDAILAAIGMIGVLTIGILTIANYSDSAVKSAALMIALAAAMVIMAKAVDVVCNAMVAVQNVDWTTIAAIGAVIGVLTAAIVGLGAVLGNDPVIAAGAALVTVLIYALAKAFEVLAPAMAPIADAFTVIMNAITQFATAMMSALTNVAVVLSSIFSTILAAVGQFVTTIITAVNSIITTISNAALTVSLAAINFSTAFNMITNSLLQLSTLSLAQGATIAANIVMIGVALSAAFNLVTATGVAAAIGLIVAAATLLSTIITTLLAPALASLSSVGTEIAKNISTGVTSSTSIVISAGNTLMAKLLSSLKAKATGARAIGVWVGKSLAGGIKQGNQTAYDAGTILAKNAEEGIRNKLGIHSFSTYIASSIGEWVGPSLAGGMLNKLGIVTDAGEQLGQAAYDGANSKTDEFNSLGATQATDYANSFISTAGSKISAFLNKVKAEVIGIWRMISGQAKLASGATNDVLTNQEVSAKWLALDSGTRESYGSYDNFYKEVKNHKELLKKQTTELQKAAEENEKATEEYESAGLGSTGGGGGSSGGSSGAAEAAEEVKTAIKTVTEEITDYSDYFNIFNYAGEAVTSFRDQYKSTLDTFADVDPIQTSKNAVQLFALNLYKNSGKMEEANKSYQESVNEVLETELTETERSQQLADLKASHIKQRLEEIQEVYEDYIQTIKDGIQNDIDMLNEFSDSSEETMDTYLENMQSQIDAVNTWEYKMRELASRDGMTTDVYQYLIDQGFKNGYHLVNELFEASSDQLEEFTDKFNRLEGGTLSDLAGERISNAMMGLQTGLTSATTENADQIVQAMDKSLASALNEVNPDESLGTTLADSMTSSFKKGLEIIVDDTEGYTAPLKESMSNLGTCISEGVTTGIKNGESSVTTAVTELGEASKDAFADSVDAHSPARDFIDKAMDCIDGLVVGFQNGIEKVRAAMTEVGNAAKESFALVMASENWLPSGGTILSYMSEGIGRDFANLKNSITESVEKARLELEQMMHDKFFGVGQYTVQGLIDGLLSKLENLREAAEELADAMESEVEEDLDINSPSKVFMRLGQYTGEGFVNGLKSYVSKAASTASMLSDATITTITDGLNAMANLAADEMDEPTITPVLDLSEIQNGSRKLNSLLGRQTGIDLTTANANARAASKDFSSSGKSNSSSNTNMSSNQSPTYSFTQNNYSPKALSRIDIYRQTKNQFSALKGLA